jgi:hypothetical protein
MSIKEALNNLKREQRAVISIQQQILHVALSFVFGILLGFLAKFSDTISSNAPLGNIFGNVSDVTTRLGIWVFLATLLAAWSPRPRLGAIKVLAFFVGMLFTYYIYSMILFGFFPTYYFIRWGVIALLSPIAAYIVWYGRGKGWLAALCAALPIGLLISTAYPVFYTFSITHGLEMVLAIMLFILLSANLKQGLRLFALTILVVPLFRNTNLLSYIFGGL